MKAIVCTKYGPPEVLQFKEVEKPVPGSNVVCVRIFATAVTTSDCYVRGFNVTPWLKLPMALAIGFGKPRRPILGMVFAGEVESAGSGVKKFKKGDQVYGFDIFRFGTYAEYKCKTETSMITIKPSNTTYEEAAAIPYGGLLALHYLRKGNIQSRQNVLIHGASGAVGTSAVQLAKHFGSNVTGVCSTGNLEMVKSLGADTVIDYTKEDFTDKGEQYDLILDAVPAFKAKRKELKSKSGKALAPGGVCISVDDGSPKIGVEDLVLLKELVEAGKLRAVIDRCYPLEQTAEAHRYVEMGHKKGNVVITV